MLPNVLFSIIPSILEYMFLSNYVPIARVRGDGVKWVILDKMGQLHYSAP